MGIIKQGILGGLSGKVGTVVGSSWKGINYLRALPSKVSNPRTLAQQNTRMKIAMLVRFLKACTNLVRIGFKAFAINKSAFNVATSYNFHKAFVGTYPNLELDFSKVMISRGNLQGAAAGSAISETPGKVTISWGDNSGDTNANESDVAILLIYNPATETSVQQMNAGIRTTGSAEIEVPSAWQGNLVHSYIVFSDSSHSAGRLASDFISDSVYAGEVVVM